MITKKHLIEIEEFIGYSCEAGVIPGLEPGGLAIRVKARLPDGQLYISQQEFPEKTFSLVGLDVEIEYFKNWAKRHLDAAFKDGNNENNQST